MTARRILTAAMMAAALAGAVAPSGAEARGWGGRGYHGGWSHRGYGHGGGVFGAIVGGLVVGGLVAAIGGAGGRDRGDSDEADRGADPEEEAAVDQCARRIENETAGTVEDIDAVDRFGDGWRVRGTVDAGRRGDGGEPGAFTGRDSFSCSIVAGRVDDIRFGSEAAPEPAPAR